jgi:hypothetical protein
MNFTKKLRFAPAFERRYAFNATLIFYFTRETHVFSFINHSLRVGYLFRANNLLNMMSKGCKS